MYPGITLKPLLLALSRAPASPSPQPSPASPSGRAPASGPRRRRRRAPAAATRATRCTTARCAGRGRCGSRPPGSRRLARAGRRRSRRPRRGLGVGKLKEVFIKGCRTSCIWCLMICLSHQSIDKMQYTHLVVHIYILMMLPVNVHHPAFRVPCHRRVAGAQRAGHAVHALLSHEHEAGSLLGA